MMYVAKVIVYEPDYNEIRTEQLFISGDNYSDVTEKLVNYYGENETENISISIFSPDDFVQFDEEDSDLFNMVKSKLEKKVIW